MLTVPITACATSVQLKIKMLLHDTTVTFFLFSYRILRKESKMIRSSVDTKVGEFIENFNVKPDSPKYGNMLKIDETFVDPRVRWNPQDNKLYGVCHQHGANECIEFVDCETVQNLADLVSSGSVHIPKESMVVAIGSNSTSCTVQIVAALPVCSKKEIEFQSKLIQTLSNDIVEKTGAPFLNWATDGDATRRQIFNKLMDSRLNETSSLFPTISQLKLIDHAVGCHEETTNYDAKHLAKRLRNFLIKTFSVGNETVITKLDMKQILSCARNTSSHSTQSMLNPDDKQNVALATQMLLHFCESVSNVENLKEINFRVSNAAVELHLFTFVIEGVLILYSALDASIEEQLQVISSAAHILLILQRTLDKFLPNQLYHDLQSTFEDAFYSAVKWKIGHPNEPLYLMLLGNDSIERAFGNMRLKYRHSGIDNLELINASRSIELATNILTKNCNWSSGKRSVMRRLCLDYSNPQDRNADSLLLKDVNIVSAWNVGRAKVEMILNRFPKYCGNACSFAELAQKGVTLKKPFGAQIIGVSELEDDDDEISSLSADALSSANSDNEDEDMEGAGTGPESDHGQSEDELNDSTQTIIDMVPLPRVSHDPQIEIEGVPIYKATFVKNAFSSNPLSSDRLRRVRGYTRFEEEADNVASTDDTLMAGDPILVSHQGALLICVIKAIKKADQRCKSLNICDLNRLNVSFTVQRLQLESSNDYFFWNEELIGEEFTVVGPNCYAVQPKLKEHDGSYRYSFEKQILSELSVSIETASTSDSNSNAAVLSSSHKVSCRVCGLMIPLNKMRQHIGCHLVRNTISGINICGFCGGNSCENILTQTSRKKTTAFFKIQSNCQYFVQLKRKPQFSVRNPCSNYVTLCQICSASVWTYNMKCHYTEHHPAEESVPSHITDEEFRQMRKLLY